MASYVVALASLGTDVCVASSARGDHALDLRSIGTGSVDIISTPWTDSRPKKLLTLLRVLRKGIAHDPHLVSELVARLHRERGLSHGLMKRLYVLTPLTAWPADVIHLGWLEAAARWMESLPELKSPLVVTCHGSDVRIDSLASDQYRRRVKVVFERSDLVHCVSEELANRAVSLGADPAKVFVQPWGIDTRFFRPSPTPAGGATRNPASSAFRVISVGRYHWVKGLDFALLAVRELRRAGIDVEYTIIGNGNEKDRLRLLTTIRDLDLDRCVILRGTVAPEEVLEALRASDAYLLASVSEGLNNSTLEAMATGVPVVVTDVGGMREAVTDRVNGLVVEARDPHAIAAALLELARDTELSRDLGTKARQRIVDDFDSRACAGAMLDRYRRLVDTP
jgi:colanic acid/amylovoran biosynthesis glycosyltransferase